MAYKFGQIEIYYGRNKGGIKHKKKTGYNRKMRRFLKDVSFTPANHPFKGYQ